MPEGGDTITDSLTRLETDADFRAWVRDELKHTRRQLLHIGATLDLLLKMAQHDEERDVQMEAGHG